MVLMGAWSHWLIVGVTLAAVETSTAVHRTSPGVVKLIVKAYIDELLQSGKVLDEGLRNRLEKLSEHISSHPALSQRHLYVGEEPPAHGPDEPVGGAGAPALSLRKRQDLTSSQYPSEEICSTISQWEQINSTNDMNNNPVEVVQEEGLQQYVFTYRCAKSKGGPCTGISSLYQSECTERYGWMYLYYKRETSDAPQWGYVEAPHHCACKIQPKIGLLTTPAEEQ